MQHQLAVKNNFSTYKSLFGEIVQYTGAYAMAILGVVWRDACVCMLRAIEFYLSFRLVPLSDPVQDDQIRSIVSVRKDGRAILPFAIVYINEFAYLHSYSLCFTTQDSIRCINIWQYFLHL